MVEVQLQMTYGNRHLPALVADTLSGRGAAEAVPRAVHPCA
jgi:hypothetical protein